jgi:hypothetical protein
VAFSRLIAFLLELARAEFYGSVHIQFRRGQIGIVKREETFEAEKLPITDTAQLAMMQTGRFPVEPAGAR